MHLLDAFGIPVRLHWSFLGLAGAGVLYAGVSGGLLGMGMATVVGVALFSSVVLHELGHALAARHFGIETEHITLYPFGGVAAIRGMPTAPHQELWIAAAGPAVNFALALLCVMLGAVTGSGLLLLVAALNMGMGLFNLVPAFPMDGGRILRALLARRMGWYPASRLAIGIGTGFAWTFLGLGLVLWHPSLLMVGGFLLFALAGERQRLWWMMANDLGWRVAWKRPRWGF